MVLWHRSMMHVACLCVAWNALRNPSLRGPEVLALRVCGSKGFLCPFLGFDPDASTKTSMSINIEILKYKRDFEMPV